MQGAAIGGKITATYDSDVGWDHLDVPVRYWTPEYSTMVVTFKTTGTAMGSCGRRREYGIGVNSSTTVVELAYNPVASLPYNEETGEYTSTVNLTGISRIAMLNFYFDSGWVEDFAGTRTGGDHVHRILPRRGDRSRGTAARPRHRHHGTSP